MKYENRFLYASLIVLLPLSYLNAATLAIDSGSFTDASNWDNGVPTVSNVGTVDDSSRTLDLQGTVTTAAVVQSDGVVQKSSATANYSLLNGSYNISGGTLQLIGGTGDLVFNSNNLSVSGSGTVSANDIVTSNSTVVSMSGGSISTSQQLFLNTSNSFTLSGGSVTVGTTLTLNNASGSIVFDVGSGVISAGALGGTGFIDFVNGSTGSLTISGYNETNYESLWSDSRLRFDGSNSGAFSDHFDVIGSTLTPIPEPSSASLLLGISALLMLTRRGVKN